MTADVAIIGGAGHVGLPLGLMLAARGMTVLLCDHNERALAAIGSGKLPAMDEGAAPLLFDALKNGRLLFSARTEDAATAPVVIVTIGTPVDEFHTPTHNGIRACMDAILPRLTDAHLIVLRSTVYPGTTAWVAQYLRRAGSGAKVAFCPERVVQGHSVRELQQMPQLIGGTTPEATAVASRLFATFAPEIITMEPLEAEFAKLFANTYRYIQFAATNAFYMMANSAGANYHNILAGMTHNYPRAQGIPRPGFAAGPCLFKDTMQLVAFTGNQFPLGHDAMLVNEGLALYVVARMRQQFDLRDKTVGLLGMAFKANSDDTRSSLSYKMKKLLRVHAAEVLTTDPFVTTDPELLPLAEVVAHSDILVLSTPHDAYRALDAGGKPVVNVWEGGLMPRPQPTLGF